MPYLSQRVWTSLQLILGFILKSELSSLPHFSKSGSAMPPNQAYMDSSRKWQVK